MVQYYHGFDEALFILAVFATAFSLSVIITYLFFVELRQLRYVELVFYISLNDFIATFGIILAATINTPSACFFQAFVVDFNFMASMMWASYVTYQVWTVVCRNKIDQNFFWGHVLCWGLPLLTTVLPLITNDYGYTDDLPWCFLINRKNSPPWGLLVWGLLSFYAWFWLGVIISIAFVVHIFIKMRQMDIVLDTVRHTMRKLCLYPIITTICWGLLSTSTVFGDSGYGNETTLESVGIHLAILQGVLNPIVFFRFNPTVRKRWVMFFYTFYFTWLMQDEQSMSIQENENTTFLDAVKGEVDYCPSEETNSSINILRFMSEGPFYFGWLRESLIRFSETAPPIVGEETRRSSMASEYEENIKPFSRPSLQFSQYYTSWAASHEGKAVTGRDVGDLELPSTSISSTTPIPPPNSFSDR